MNINRLKQRIKFGFRQTHSRTSRNITMQDAKQILANTPNVVLIDVRSPQEYKEYHIDGAICIPYYEIQYRINNEVPNKDALIILYCQYGIRSKKAMEILLKLGYRNVYHIKSGLEG